MIRAPSSGRRTSNSTLVPQEIMPVFFQVSEVWLHELRKLVVFCPGLSCQCCFTWQKAEQQQQMLLESLCSSYDRTLSFSCTHTHTHTCSSSLAISVLFSCRSASALEVPHHAKFILTMLFQTITRVSVLWRNSHFSCSTGEQCEKQIHERVLWWCSEDVSLLADLWSLSTHWSLEGAEEVHVHPSPPPHSTANTHSWTQTPT